MHDVRPTIHVAETNLQTRSLFVSDGFPNGAEGENDDANDEALAQIDAVERILAVGVQRDVDAIRTIGRILLRLSLDPRADEPIKQRLGVLAADAEAIFAESVAASVETARHLRERTRADCSRLRVAFRERRRTNGVRDGGERG